MNFIVPPCSKCLLVSSNCACGFPCLWWHYKEKLRVDKVRNIIVYIKLQSSQHKFLISVTLIPWTWEQKNLLSTPEPRFFVISPWYCGHLWNVLVTKKYRRIIVMKAIQLTRIIYMTERLNGHEESDCVLGCELCRHSNLLPPSAG